MRQHTMRCTAGAKGDPIGTAETRGAPRRKGSSKASHEAAEPAQFSQQTVCNAVAQAAKRT